MSEKRRQGELESQVLGVLWDNPSGLSSQQILTSLGAEIKITTLLTVLSRLEEKNLVRKEPGTGRSLNFTPSTSREEHTARQLLSLLEDNNPAAVFSHFAAGLNSKQVAQLKKVLEK